MRGAKDGSRKSQNIVRAGMKTGALAGYAALLVAPAALAGIKFQSYQTHSHVSVNVDPSVTYSVEKVEKDGKVVGLRLILNNVREPLEDLTRQSDVRTEDVKVVRSRVPGGSRVAYEFHLSDKARAAGIEYFDYRNKAPAEIALDYWLKSQKVEETAKTKKKGSAASVSKSKKVASRVVHHPKKKAAKTVAHIGCGEQLIPALDGFVNWEIYHKPFDYRGYFKLMPADSGYDYPLVKPRRGEALGARAKEMAHYRLAFKLYKQSKYALVLRTIGFFETEFPKSPLSGELDFLRANTLVQLSRMLRTERYMDQALDIFRRVVLEAPDSRRGRAALAFIVQERMERETPVFVLEYALMGAEQKPLHMDAKEADVQRSVYRLAAAESLFALGEYDRAERSYQYVLDQGNSMSVEAAFRIGEVFSARKFWERAVIAYEKAIRSYPDKANRFPTAWFNLAEAYSRLGRRDESERTYQEFVKRFPADDAMWAAHLRLAEYAQMSIKGRDEKVADKIRSGYEFVINRFPFTAGSAMAELRLAACYRGLKTDDRIAELFDHFFTKRELKKFESPFSKLDQVEPWFDLIEARFYAGNNEPRKALRHADQYRHKLDKVQYGDGFRKIYADATVKLITGIVEGNEDRSNELLAAVEHYGALAPKPAPFSYLLSIARARQQHGDYAALQSEIKELEKRLSEASDLEKDWFRLIRARLGRVLGEKPEVVIGELAHMRDNGELAAIKYEELARSALDKKDLRAAIAYDDRLIESALGSKLSLERLLEAHVRRIESYAGLREAANVVKYSEYALLKLGTHTEYRVQLSRIRELRALALYDSGNYKLALDSVDRILDAQVNHPRKSEFEFIRGKCLSALGREGEALEAFRKLAQAANQDVWQKSAQAELDQIQWENNVANQLKDRRSSQ